MFDQFTAQGLAVFPLIRLSKKPTKSATGWPSFNWFDNEAHRTEIEANRGYGVSLNSDWIVVDYDSYKEGAQESLQKLIELGLSLETFTVESARGGNHFYYRNPTKQRITKNPKTEDGKHESFKGIDFLSVGCFTVGPGTITPDGVYSVITGDIPSAIDAPVSLLEVLERKEAALSTVTTDIDTETELARYKTIVDSTTGVEQGSRGSSAYKLAAKGKDLGLSEADVLDVLMEWDERCSPPAGASGIMLAIKNAYNYAKNTHGVASVNVALFEADSNIDSERSELTGWDQDGKGKMKATLNNLATILKLEEIAGAPGSFYQLFKYNEFEKVVEMDRKPFFRSFRDSKELILSNMDILRVRDFIARHYRIDYTTENIRHAITVEAYTRCYHPIRSWLEGLQWDGKPRLGKLFNEYFNFTSDDPEELIYRSAVGRAFVLASIYRIFSPGYKWDACLVLAGLTNVGKSLFVEIMGSKKYSNALSKMSTEPNELHKMAGLWWIEYAELSAAKKSDINEIKAFISITSDIYRKPYDPLPERHLRECVMVWTLNPEYEGFLRDETGNRRFLIIEADNMLDLDGLTRDREQLFAEGMQLFKQGIEPLTFLTDEVVARKAKDKQTENLKDNSDIWMEEVQHWLSKQTDFPDRYKWFHAATPVTILREALGLHTADKHDHRAKLRLARVMRDLGWNHVQSNGRNLYYDPNSDEI